MEKIKAIEIALNNELRERDFYLKQSEKSADPLGKKMFATIAQEEEEHYEYLKELHQKLQKAGKWPDDISAVIKETNVKQVLDELVDKVHYKSTATADDKEALRIAINFEKSAYQFYTELIKQSDQPNEKALFEQLAALEMEHMTSLEETLLYFEDPADWFAQHEKPTLDG
ncbi:ferritin family protein [bacterium]|nr:ferritin family protein [bacterium]